MRWKRSKTILQSASGTCSRMERMYGSQMSRAIPARLASCSGASCWKNPSKLSFLRSGSNVFHLPGLCIHDEGQVSMLLASGLLVNADVPQGLRPLAGSPAANGTVHDPPRLITEDSFLQTWMFQFTNAVPNSAGFATPTRFISSSWTVLASLAARNPTPR